MKKIETIWHHILFSALNEKKFSFTQQEIAKKFGYSLSTVNYALNIPTEIGAVRKESKFFVIDNLIKLIYFWASQRNLRADIVYQTNIKAAVSEIEGLVPSGSIYACYSAACKILTEPPADYSVVHCYADEQVLRQFKKRFPAEKHQTPNLFVLKADKTMSQYGDITTLPQTFVDIWNLKDWYSREFTRILEQKINALLS